jgi:N-acetylglucosaminyldiphosphoundecaprenol N-acetyl-beta-D-mannosaminyltransferase
LCNETDCGCDSSVPVRGDTLGVETQLMGDHLAEGSGGQALRWPRKYELFGVRVSDTQYSELVDLLLEAAGCGQSAIVDHMPVHGLVEASTKPPLTEVFNDFDVVAPDGQPVRWALNHFHGLGLKDRVYGPELMARLCAAAERASLSVYLYGGSPECNQQLGVALRERFPKLLIAGQESPPFRELTREEDERTVERINNSGALFVFVGLGCPKQEIFAHKHRRQLRGIQVCVGAAFDFIGGTKRMAPKWMQDRGLEWLFRLTHEPRRLYGRYLRTNSIFLTLWLRQALIGRMRDRSPEGLSNDGGRSP